MTTAPPATRPTPPPARTAPTRAATAPAQPAGPVNFAKLDANNTTGHRVCFYGPGGTGKTSLAAIAPGPVVFFDFDDSLPRLANQLPDGVDVRRIEIEPEWGALLAAINSPGWDDAKTIVIDSVTKAEELCSDWVVANVPHEKAEVRIKRIEDYGFGKGLTHIYGEFLKLLAALDRHANAGRHCVLIAHDCTATVPNPMGEDFIRFEPRLQAPASGKSSIRLRVREWADHLCFIGYDVNARGGKGQGRGTRSIYPVELPHAMAKSRTLADRLNYDKHDAAFWQAIGS